MISCSLRVGAKRARIWSRPEATGPMFSCSPRHAYLKRCDPSNGVGLWTLTRAESTLDVGGDGILCLGKATSSITRDKGSVMALVHNFSGSLDSVEQG